MRRNYSIDAYRVCLMFGICLLHSISQAGHNVAWAANMLEWCVPGFMFISGWFGIKFSMGKALKLYGISFYCALMYVAFDVVVSGEGAGDSCVIRAYDIATGQWFLNAYVVVMCLSPMVNLAIEKMTMKHLYPLLLCVFGWSFATTLPVVGKFIPKSAGLSAYSFLTLLGVYVFGRVARREHDLASPLWKKVTSLRLMLPLCAVSLACAGIGLGDYNSPFAFCLAGCACVLFSRVKLPCALAKTCCFLGSSMFSVYLMHSHGRAWGYLKIVQDYLLGKGFPLVVAYLMTALIVFSLCVVADLPRRGVAAICNKLK